jgi:hypothetical protein
MCSLWIFQVMWFFSLTPVVFINYVYFQGQKAFLSIEERK